MKRFADTRAAGVLRRSRGSGGSSMAAVGSVPRQVPGRALLGNQAMAWLLRGPSLSQPGDHAELDAERIAAAALHGPSRESVARSGLGPRQGGGAAPARSELPAGSALEQVRGRGGRPLCGPDRRFWEQRFGRDLGAVRVHTDSTADAAAREIGALAYTDGSDIAFRTGRFAPHTERGRRLLAHELSHALAPAPGLYRAPDPELTEEEKKAKEAAEKSAEEKPVEPPPIDFNFSGLLGPVYRDLFGRGFIGFRSGEALRYDPTLRLKGTEFASAYNLGLGLLPPAINEGLGLRPNFGEEGFEAYENYVKGMSPLAPGEATDFAGNVLNLASLAGGVRIGDYFGSELFLKHRLWPYLNADWGLFRALGLIGTAQGLYSAGYAIGEAARSEPRKPEEMITPPWLAHLTVPKGLAEAGLKAPVFKPPTVFGGLGPITAPTYPASAYSHFSDEAILDAAKLDYKESVDKSGHELSLGLPLNLSGLFALGNEKAPGLSEQADLAKYRGGQLSLWGAYQSSRPPATAPFDPYKQPFKYGEGGILGGYGGHTLLFEGGARSGEEGRTSSFLRGGYSFSGAEGSVLKEAGLTGTWLDWSQTDPAAAGGPAGSAFRLTPFLTFGDFLPDKDKTLSVSAAGSVSFGSRRDPDLSLLRLGLAYEQRRRDDQGKVVTTGLPAWSLGGAFSMARPQWWNPEMPYLYGAQLKGNVDRFFFGTQLNFGDTRLTDQQAQALGIEPAKRKDFELLLNLGWNFDVYQRARKSR